MILVNALGDACPIPVVKTKNAIKELGGSSVVETLVDNEIAVQNLTKMANQKGYGVKSEKLAPNQFKVTMSIEGAELRFVPADGRGRLDCGVFEKLIGQGADAVICTHASNLTGDMVDIARVSRLAHGAGAILVVDASQTAGAFPLNMTELGIDVLCFTGHKGLMGPQGTGGLCVRPGLELRPWKVGGTGIHSFSPEQPEDMPTRLEAGTLNTHGNAGLSAAVDFIQATGVETIRAKEDRLARRFYQGVSGLPNVKIYGDFAAPYCAPIVSLNIGDEDSGTISDLLFQRYDIATRPGAHCAPRLHRALGTEEQGAVRFSFSWFNTEDEVDAAAQAVGKLAE